MGLSLVLRTSQAEMLERRVIASWESSRPAPKELSPATPAAQEAVVEATEAPEPRSLSPTILNGELLESDKVTYGTRLETLGHLHGTATLSTVDRG